MSLLGARACKAIESEGKLGIPAIVFWQALPLPREFLGQERGGRLLPRVPGPVWGATGRPHARARLGAGFARLIGRL